MRSWTPLNLEVFNGRVPDDFTWFRGNHGFRFGTNYIHTKLGGYFDFGAFGYELTFFDDPSVITTNAARDHQRWRQAGRPNDPKLEGQARGGARRRGGPERRDDRLTQQQSNAVANRLRACCPRPSTDRTPVALVQ